MKIENLIGQTITNIVDCDDELLLIYTHEALYIMGGENSNTFMQEVIGDPCILINKMVLDIVVDEVKSHIGDLNINTRKYTIKVETGEVILQWRSIARDAKPTEVSINKAPAGIHNLHPLTIYS